MKTIKAVLKILLLITIKIFFIITCYLLSIKLNNIYIDPHNNLDSSVNNIKKDQDKLDNKKLDDSQSKLKSKSRTKMIKNANNIPEEVLDLALKAYSKAKSQGLVDNNKLTIIDYSQPSDKKRMWVIDMDKKSVDINTYVSHGSRSGGRVSKEFSNLLESHKSSLGVMKTGKTYYGSRGLSLHIHGLEKNINDNVFRRHVVIHGASYVNEQHAKHYHQVGRSFGCPAVDYKIVKQLINKVANGSIIFSYYPSKKWMNASKFL